ncbi:Uncharacterized protein APZ42_012571 [Daphnia magna]|uniref:MULE transposase domain-containing protein n=1 Tax=Daphnia magna TaxID=35525 RepID=A0A162RMT1_9CRUS|nr:Uncharacterized protein APZ42_012571 [Daphnia magna]
MTRYLVVTCKTRLKIQILHMAPEALKFVKDTLTAGAQPAVMSKLLQDKFGTNLISKDLINIKRTLTGKSQDEWADTVAFLQELQKILTTSSRCCRVLKKKLPRYSSNLSSNNNDVSLTEVTITDKDCAEISALWKLFPKASGILCQFHVLKAVDTHLQNKFKTSLDKKNEIRGFGKEIAAFFDGNWFNIADNYHHTLKQVLQKNRRLLEVIRRLFNLVRLRLSDRKLKQSIREVRFNTKGKHPVLNTVNLKTCNTCKLLEGEMKIVQWKAYDFVLNEELDTYSIASRHTTYSLKRDLTASTSATSRTTRKFPLDHSWIIGGMSVKSCSSLSVFKNWNALFQAAYKEAHYRQGLVQLCQYYFSETVPQSSPVQHLTDLVIDLASAAADESHEVTSKSITENKVNKVKVSLGEEEMFLREEAEHLMVGLSDMPVSDHEVAMEDSFSPTSPDLIIKPVEESQSTACVPIRNPYMLKFLVKVEPVIKNNWLGTSIVNLAMKILKLNHPAIGGFYCSILGGSLEFPGATGQQWLQIVHDGANHWLLIAKSFSLPEHVLVYDSSPVVNVRQHVLSCMASLLQTPKPTMTYVVRGCQKQGNIFHCGVFAIAFATSLANGQDPTEILYDPVKLRDHLRTCIDTEVLSPFPSTYCRPRNRGEKIQSIDVFCYCRRTDYASDCKPDSLEMVACDKRGSNCVILVNKMFDNTFPVETNDLECIFNDLNFT